MDTDFFREHFITFLNEYQPHLAGDERLISSRSRAAAKIFHEVYDKGYDYQAAMERAYFELTDGLQESLYRFICGWISEDFASEVPEAGRKEFSMSILPDCQYILDRYAYSDMDADEATFRMQEEMEKAIWERISSR